jgi:DNA-binding SARP family transcriptional activator
MVGWGVEVYDAGMGGDAADGGLVVAGPVEVGVAAGVVAPVAQPRQRALLGLVGMAAGRLISAEALVNGVWREDWSPRCEQSLHALVYQPWRWLTSLELGRGGVRLAGDGYRLALGHGELDVTAFADPAGRGRAAVRAGDPARAAGTFGHALGVRWVVALADAAPLCPSSVVLEERIDYDLAADRNTDVAWELAAPLTEFPSRERLAVLLRTALYRYGRRGEALAVDDTPGGCSRMSLAWTSGRSWPDCRPWSSPATRLSTLEPRYGPARRSRAVCRWRPRKLGPR